MLTPLEIVLKMSAKVSILTTIGMFGPDVHDKMQAEVASISESLTDSSKPMDMPQIKENDAFLDKKLGQIRSAYNGPMGMLIEYLLDPNQNARDAVLNCTQTFSKEDYQELRNVISDDKLELLGLPKKDQVLQ